MLFRPKIPFDWRDIELMVSVEPHYGISRNRFLANKLVYVMTYRRTDRCCLRPDLRG